MLTTVKSSHKIVCPCRAITCHWGVPVQRTMYSNVSPSLLFGCCAWRLIRSSWFLLVWGHFGMLTSDQHVLLSLLLCLPTGIQSIAHLSGRISSYLSVCPKDFSQQRWPRVVFDILLHIVTASFHSWLQGFFGDSSGETRSACAVYISV